MAKSFSLMSGMRTKKAKKHKTFIILNFIRSYSQHLQLDGLINYATSFTKEFLIQQVCSFKLGDRLTVIYPLLNLRTYYYRNHFIV